MYNNRYSDLINGGINLKNILKYIPGFRTGQKWKMIIALIYYLIALLDLTNGFNLFLIRFIMPFIFFSFVNIFKLRNYWREAFREKGEARIKVNAALLKCIGFIIVLFVAFATLPTTKNNSLVSDNIKETKDIQTTTVTNKKNIETTDNKTLSSNTQTSFENHKSKENTTHTKESTTHTQDNKIVPTKPAVKNSKNNATIKNNESLKKTQKKQNVTKKSVKKSRQVWLSETGKKYHSISNCGRMNPNRARKVSIEEAESLGCGPCSKCM